LIPIVALGVGLALLRIVGGFAAGAGRPFSIEDAGTVQFVLNTNVAALSSAMGILIALVLLTVQLTAQRYSYDIIGIFIQSWVNAALLGLFILTICFNLWVGTVQTAGQVQSEGAVVALVLTTLCFAVLPPYVVYLFDVLRPENILNYLQRELLKAVDWSRPAADPAARRAAAYGRIDQMTDIAMTAVNLSDSSVARHSVWVLYLAVAQYLENKSRLSHVWFNVAGDDMEGQHELIQQEVEESRTWLERRALDEVQEVFYATLNRMHEVNNLIAEVTRLLGEKAVALDDAGAVRATMKFFNTFLREAMNLGDTRSGYHVLYQYRLLADAALQRRPEVSLEIADRLSYYGDAAASGPLLWMSAAAAHDLRILAETSVGRGVDLAITAQIVGDLIETLQRAETKQSPALPQLYKTVAALGSFFLDRGEQALAQELRKRLDCLPAAALDEIGRELTACLDPVFWEVTDRVVNFDYVEPEIRAALPRFLWSEE
jgi:hypothetical protein